MLQNCYNYLSSVIIQNLIITFKIFYAPIFYISTMSFIFPDTNIASSFTVFSAFHRLYYIFPGVILCLLSAKLNFSLHKKYLCLKNYIIIFSSTCRELTACLNTNLPYFKPQDEITDALPFGTI